MKHSKMIYFFAVALTIVTFPALASARGARMPKSIAKSHFTILGRETLNGTALKAGDYNVIASDSTISFFSRP